MMQELSGLIVQRRLHRSTAGEEKDDRFYKTPVDEMHIRGISARYGIDVDFIFGELPHFSSTLVRKSPVHWRAFLPSRVAAYLEQRPHLLAQLTGAWPHLPCTALQQPPAGAAEVQLADALE